MSVFLKNHLRALLFVKSLRLKAKTAIGKFMRMLQSCQASFLFLSGSAAVNQHVIVQRGTTADCSTAHHCWWENQTARRPRSRTHWGIRRKGLMADRSWCEKKTNQLKNECVSEEEHVFTFQVAAFDIDNAAPHPGRQERTANKKIEIISFCYYYQ